ncbi:putative SAM-dependent methyltransferase [Wenyingzhuangia aestuarii]|nr:putative SAM-dependent methyltransferase [Wenyingzhuangia aestuarii]
MFKTILNVIPRPWLIKASYAAKPFLNLYYKGSNYTDPINGKSYRKFLPYGYEHQRENVLAPGTLSLERHRLLWLYLTNHSDFFKQPKKVLHVAPEQCFYKLFRNQKNLEYTTTDLFSPLADVKADICDLPFADNSYDVIFCNHVLEHITDDTKAMNELFRVLKPGGWGIFQIPQDVTKADTYEDFTITDPKERQKHFGQYDHVRIYGLDYFKRLENVGFQVHQFKTTEHFSSAAIKKYALMKNEILPVCAKPF